MNKTTKTQRIFIRLILLVCFGIGFGIPALEATASPVKTGGDPLVWLKFEDNLTNSGTGEVDAVNVGTAQYTDGPGGSRAYDFRVSGNNELSLPGYTGINGADARTVALWVRTEMDGSVGSLVHWGAGGTNSRASFRVMGDGVIRFEWQGNGRNSLTMVNDGQWHHVAYTYDGSQLKIFVNGVEENSVNHSLNTGNAGETDVEIGVQLDGFRFTGAMTDVRIYDRALSEEEIGLLMALVETYTVTFDVENMDGMPISEAIITLGGVTNPPGDYVFEDVQAGNQTYKVEHPAYQNVEDGLLVTKNMTVPVVLLEEGVILPVIWLEFNNNLNNSGSEELTASTDGTPQYADGPGAKNAYVFDGDNHLSLPGYNGIADANPRTVALWINTSASTRQSLAHWGTAANFTRNTFAVQNTGLLRLEWAGGGLNSTQSVNDGEWRHVAYTYDGSRVQLYIDGQPETGQDIALSTAGSEVQLGVRGAGELFNGSMADVRIYDRALSEEEIGSLMAPAPVSFRSSQTGQWDESTTWETSEDEETWSPASLTPGQLHNVYIQTGHSVTLIEDHSCKNLTIEPNGLLTIAPAGGLTVTETLTNNAGVEGLVIKSGGSLLHNSANVPATMERLFDTAETWRLVSSPVSGQSVSGDWTPSGTYAGDHGYDFYAYDEATATWLNQKFGENDIAEFVSGQGYLVSFETADQTKAFAGDLHAGDVTIEVTNSGGGDFAGSNLIGNPYASGIDWKIADRTLFADDFAYVYDRVSSEEGVSEGYKTVDGSIVGAWIAPNQGFFVIKETAGTANFSFTNDMRGHGGTLTKGGSASDAVVLRLGNESYFDQTTLRLRDNATFARDRSDAMKLYSLNDHLPQLYTYTSDEVKVAINSIPHIDEEKPITVGARIPADGSYSLSVNEISGRFQSSPLYLLDIAKGDVHNLKENPEYSFQASKGDVPSLFELWFTQPTDVPKLPAASLTRMYTYGQTLYMEFGREATGRTLEVFDTSGRRLMHKTLGSGMIHTTQLNLHTGVYIVRVTSATETETKRIFVE
jgi:hypothetical protein